LLGFATIAHEVCNLLALVPMPDLRLWAGDHDELEAGVAMVGEAIGPLVAPGRSESANSKRGLLTSALKAYAKGKDHGGLPGFLDFLRELPLEDGLGLQNEGKLTRQMADGLAVAMATSPMLRSDGRPLDPALLFGTALPPTRTRISVVNLNVGLPTLEGKRQFLNQLAMTLFAWVKRNPDPAPRPLRGLLVIDEARDFLPGTAGSACKESLIRLAAQARKYHLGLVFATQNPKDVDHRVVANCATHFYGKVNSPAAIAAVRGLIEEKGGSGEDVARLGQGQFYAHNAELGLTAPVRIAAPLCLSFASRNTPDEADVIRRAAAGRAAVEASAR